MAQDKKSVTSLLINIAEKSDQQYKDLDIRLDNIEKVMIAQEINLKAHMQRSDHLETIIENIKDQELKPLHKHVSMVEGAFKLLGLIALLVSIVAGLASLFGFI